MLGVGMHPILAGIRAISCAAIVWAICIVAAQGQGPQLTAPLAPPPLESVAPGVPAPLPPSAAPGVTPDVAQDNASDVVPPDFSNEPIVVEVRVVGNRTVKTSKILTHVRTRAGRPFRMEQIEQDVRELNRVYRFIDIKTSYQDAPNGRVVIFEVIERPTLRSVKYVGYQKVKEKTLAKETGIKAGDAADPYKVEEARKALEDYYHSKGFSVARVTIHEGNKPGDLDAIFVIHEGPKQKILWTDFVGNSIANDDRLRTQVQSKQGILWLFKGEFDPKQIEEDENRLTAYYRGLGFFRAKVAHEYTFGESGQWARVTFVINEGPRYKVRDISFLGNTKFSTDELSKDFKLHAGEYFNQNKMDADIRAMQETYGSVGYIFTDVNAENRFLEQPGQLDLVYKFTEGDRYRVGEINPEIKGEYPHTKITTVLDRISLQPGDIVDIRELRASERRLKQCGLFEVSPQTGVQPKIVFSPETAEPADSEVPADRQIARPPARPDGFRGQSPDDAEPTEDRWLERAPQGAWPCFSSRR